MPKAIIFDFDGVLVDSERYWKTIGPTIIAQLCLPSWSAHDQQRMVGHGMEGTHSILTREHNLTMSLQEYETLVLNAARSIYEIHTQPMPGAIDCLRRLSDQAITLAVASSNKREMIDAAMTRLALSTYFSSTCSGDDVPGKAKPHPDVYLLAAENLGRQPADCIAIEDSPIGIVAAKAAGMHCIALHTDDNTKQDLSAADTHVEGFLELTDELLASILR